MVQQALRRMLVYPRSTTLSMSAGEDAAQLTLATTDSVERVAGWYREVLRLNGWALQSDVTNRDGSIAIAATKGARPLWITLHSNSARREPPTRSSAPS